MRSELPGDDREGGVDAGAPGATDVAERQSRVGESDPEVSDRADGADGWQGIDATVGTVTDPADAVTDGADAGAAGPGTAAEPDVGAQESGTAAAESDDVEAETAVDVGALEQEGEIAADYVEGLLDIADMDGDIDMDVDGDRAVVSVVGATLEELVGARGEVLEALQELTRLAVQRQTGMRTRLMLDIGGYRTRRRAELTAATREVTDQVARTGVPRSLAAMTPFERKIVHGVVADAGLRSESEGEEPNRRVVVYPTG